MYERLKSSLIFILTPLAFLAGVLYYLITGNQKLRSDLKQAKADADLAKLLSERAEAKKEADNAEKAYRDSKRLYDEQSHGAGGDTDL